MMKFLSAFTIAAMLLSSVEAQTYRDVGGTVVQPTVPLPFPYFPLSPGQHNLSIASATSLTIPTNARFAIVCAGNFAAKYTTDGTTTPTVTLGMPLAAGSCVAISGRVALANFQAISANGTLDVEFFQ